MHDLLRIRRIGWALALMIALVAAACGNDDQSQSGSTSTLLADRAEANEDDESASDVTPSYGGSIVVGLEAESSTWVPGQGNIGAPVALSIYDPLVALNSEGEFEGFLAESIEPNEELTEWTLKLRDGISFHDGTALDADAVAWNFNNLHFVEGSLTYGALVGAKVQEVEVTDPLTVVYRLSEANAAFPDVLRGAAGWPVSPTAYEADPDGFTNQPVGTGPFVMREWRRDDRVEVVRNENYWFTAPNGDQLPYLDEIIFRPIPDEESRVQSLKSNDVDVMHTLRGTSVKRVLEMSDEGGYGISIHVGNTSHAAVFNVLEPPLDDVRIRRALAFATSASGVQKVIGDDGLTEPSSGFFSQDSPWYSEAVAEAYPVGAEADVETAMELVEEYKNDPDRSDNRAPGDPVEVEYRCMPDPALMQAAQLYQSMWEAVGVTTNLVQVDQATQITRTIGAADTDPAFRGDFIISCWRSGGGSNDPLTALQNEFGDVATTPSNYSNYTDPEIDEQLEILRTSSSLADRYAAVERIGLIAAEQMPILFVSPTPTAVGYHDRVFGVANWTLPSGSQGTGTEGSTIRFHQMFVTDD